MDGLHLVGDVGGTALAALVEVGLVKASVVLVLAGTALLALRRSSAAARHLVLAMALVVLLVVPIASVVLPAWQVVPAAERAPLQTAEARRPELPASAWSLPARPAPAVTAAASAPASPPASGAGEAESSALSAGVWILFAWLVGALAVVLRFWLGFLRLARMSRRAGRPPAPLRARAARLEGELGIARAVAVRLSTEVGVPLTWGLWRPALLLPAEAVRWPDERLEAVIAHELVHVRRRDCATQALAQLACALYWFNPLVWVAARRLRAERERACDDRVLGLGLRPTSYASELLQVARAGLAGREPVPGAVAMGRRSGLERRIVAILDESLARRTPPRRACVVALLLGAVVLLSLSAVASAGRPSLSGLAGSDTSARAGVENAAARPAAPPVSFRVVHPAPHERIDTPRTPLALLRGQVVVLAFLDDRCDGCEQTANLLQYLDAPGRVGAVLGVATGIAPARALAVATGPVGPRGHRAIAMAVDPHGVVARAFGVSALPSILVLDRRGRIALRLSAPPGSQAMLRLLRPLRAEPLPADLPPAPITRPHLSVFDEPPQPFGPLPRSLRPTMTNCPYVPGSLRLAARGPSGSRLILGRGLDGGLVTVWAVAEGGVGLGCGVARFRRDRVRALARAHAGGVMGVMASEGADGRFAAAIVVLDGYTEALVDGLRIPIEHNGLIIEGSERPASVVIRGPARSRRVHIP